MRVQVRNKMSAKQVSRIKKKLRIRNRIEGTAERPRMSVFRSLKQLSVQLIDDAAGITLVHVTTLGLKIPSKTNVEAAKKLGVEVAKEAMAKKIQSVVFDRNGYLYHGKVKAIADAAREGGLKF